MLSILAWIQAAQSIEVINKENVTLNMHGRLQTFGLSDYVLDPYRDHLRIFLFVRQARLAFDGQVNTLKYDVEYAFGGEEGLKNTGGTVANSSLGLLDFAVDVPVRNDIYAKIGQFKVPYGLERLQNSGDLLYTDRSIAHLPFNQGRDVGLALYDSSQGFAWNFGLFTGGGRDNPIRNLPMRLGTPMFVFRGGYQSEAEENPFDPKQIDPDGLKPGFSVMTNLLFIRDTRVGHSTVLRVKPVEKGLLTDSNWNPFIDTADGASGSHTGDLFQGGGDLTWRTGMGSGLLTTEAEVNYGQYKNKIGWLEMTGARTQLGYQQNQWGAGLRYGVIFADNKFAKSGRVIFVNHRPVHEITPSFTFFHKKFLKIVISAPVLVDVPVSTETNLGMYVLTDQTDQTNAGPIIRQTVPSARAVVQFSF